MPQVDAVTSLANPSERSPLKKRHETIRQRRDRIRHETTNDEPGTGGHRKQTPGIHPGAIRDENPDGESAHQANPRQNAPHSLLFAGCGPQGPHQHPRHPQCDGCPDHETEQMGVGAHVGAGDVVVQGDVDDVENHGYTTQPERHVGCVTARQIVNDKEQKEWPE